MNTTGTAPSSQWPGTGRNRNHPVTAATGEPTGRAGAAPASPAPCPRACRVRLPLTSNKAADDPPGDSLRWRRRVIIGLVRNLVRALGGDLANTESGSGNQPG